MTRAKSNFIGLNNCQMLCLMLVVRLHSTGTGLWSTSHTWNFHVAATSLFPIVWKHIWNGRCVVLQHGMVTCMLVVASVMLVIEVFREHGNFVEIKRC